MLQVRDLIKLLQDIDQDRWVAVGSDYELNDVHLTAQLIDARPFVVLQPQHESVRDVFQNDAQAARIETLLTELQDAAAVGTDVD